MAKRLSSNAIQSRESSISAETWPLNALTVSTAHFTRWYEFLWLLNSIMGTHGHQSHGGAHGAVSVRVDCNAHADRLMGFDVSPARV